MGYPVDVNSILNDVTLGAYPKGATVVVGSSGNVANAQAVATLPGAANVTTWLAGFMVFAAGATVALVALGSIAGILNGPHSFIFPIPAGVLSGAQPLIIALPWPIPASAPNTPIVVTLPALGLGNTNAAVFAQGYQL